MDQSQPAIGRRDFLRIAGVGGLLAGGCALPGAAAEPTATRSGPALSRNRSDVVVVGAGTFGGWTAYHLQRLGHRVTLVDAFGPGNSRSTSGDETRGIRTGYGNREQWSGWAARSIELWKQWDAEWGTQLFTPTGDLIMRAEMDNFLSETVATWERLGIRHEVLGVDEIAYRYPQIRLDGIGVGIYEHDAGVGRSRAACLEVARQFQRLGGEVVLGRASFDESGSGRLAGIQLDGGRSLSADTFVLALGPWFGKELPRLIGESLRIPIGHVFYFGTPPEDDRFTTPNIPSWNFPGVTGWPALAHDNRGFRVRIGGRPAEDPDRSVRWIDQQFHEPARRLVEERFPALAPQPLLETRACHYEFSDSRNFMLDRYPGFENVWIAGAGNAEGFKFGPIVGEYMAGRITGTETDPELMAEFRIPEPAAIG